MTSEHPSGPRKAMHRYDDDLVALVCHHANLGMQEAHALMRERAGGESGPVGGPLATLPPDLRDAAVDGVERARRSGQLNARDHHNAWVDFLLDRGWRHGERDYETKHHPNLVYWPQLPPEERDKSRVFLSVVMGMTLDVEAA
jgi:hypothetical protein